MSSNLSQNFHSDLNSPGNGLMLRTATPEDNGFLLEVYSSTRQEEMALVNWLQSDKDSFLKMQFEAQHRYYLENYLGAKFQIILWNNQPVGRLYVHQQENEIRIMDIAILPEYRNLGIGSTLLTGILALGDQLNLPVTIHVERLNPALSLYQRLGFQLEEDKGVYLFMKRSPVGMEQSSHVG